jgi:fluoride exporter
VTAREAHEGDLPRHAALTVPLLAAVFCGGMAGAVARVEVARLLDPGAWPWPTLLVNLAGAFLLGVFATTFQERLHPATLREAVSGPGFCGALTTFSTLQVELIRLAEHGRAGAAVAYGAVSIAGGLLAVSAGTAAARWG